MIRVDLRKSLHQLERDFVELRRDQIPFAAALALTRTAWNVQRAETAALDEAFDRPTPFTRRAFAVQPARKRSPIAVVYAKDIQAEYLAPHETGGRQVLGSKRAILGPRNVTLNAYGNLPRAKLASLKARSDTFIGKVSTKSGQQISGVWQRPGGRKGARRVAKAGGLKLLIQFADPAPIQASLNYRQRAEAVVNQTFHAEMEAALAKAYATAR